MIQLPMSNPPAGLRSPEEQLWLSRLAQAPAVRLIASIDHVNAALLWDNRIAAAFKWLWVEATSYAGYETETSNILPILTSKLARDGWCCCYRTAWSWSHNRQQSAGCLLQPVLQVLQ